MKSGGFYEQGGLFLRRSFSNLLSDVLVIEVSAYCRQEETQHDQP